MKAVFKTPLVLAILSLVIVSCGKYEDGPGFSLASKKSRLVNDWKLESKYINGTEEALNDADKAFVYGVQKDGKLNYTFTMGVISVTGTGSWEFNDSKEVVTFAYSAGGISYSRNYTILRLTKNEFWGEETINNGGISVITEYHFTTN